MRVNFIGWKNDQKIEVSVEIELSVRFVGMTEKYIEVYTYLGNCGYYEVEDSEFLKFVAYDHTPDGFMCGYLTANLEHASFEVMADDYTDDKTLHVTAYEMRKEREKEYI